MRKPRKTSKMATREHENQSDVDESLSLEDENMYSKPHSTNLCSLANAYRIERSVLRFELKTREAKPPITSGILSFSFFQHKEIKFDAKVLFFFLNL